jgi:hypothetical protein
MLDAKENGTQPLAQNTRYVIRLKGYIDQGWSEWLDGFSISYEANGNTVLSGPVVDQAALHGLLAKVRDLNMTLLSVNAIDNPFSNASTPPGR